LAKGPPCGVRVQIAASLSACREQRFIWAIVLNSSSNPSQNINRRALDEFKVWPSQ
jgi:glutaredoxin-related protein